MARLKTGKGKKCSNKSWLWEKMVHMQTDNEK